MVKKEKIVDKLKEEGQRIRERLVEVKKELREIEAEMHEIQCKIPNMTHPDAPVTKWVKK